MKYNLDSIKLAYVLSLIIGLASPAFCIADDDDDDDGDAMSPLAQELFLGESPFVQEKGEIQFGVALTRLNFDANSSELKNETDLTFEFEYGITDAFTIGFEVPYVAFKVSEADEEDQSGLGDAGITFLYGLVNNEEFVLTLGAEFNLRTGDEDKDLGERESEWEPVISLATQAGAAQFMLTLGAEISDDETEKFYTAALAFPMGEMVGILEANGSIADDTVIPGEELEGDTSYITPGLLWEIGDEAEFQIGIPIGLNDHSADNGIVIKWNIEFE